jgi:hypothetical protein
MLISCTAGDSALLTAMKESVVSTVTGFSAVAKAVPLNTVTLTWTVPTPAPAGILITRKAGSTYPASPTEAGATQLSGVILANGSFIDSSGIVANTRYSYSAWTYQIDATSGAQVLTTDPKKDWADTTIGQNVGISLSTSGYVYEYLSAHQGNSQAFPITIGWISEPGGFSQTDAVLKFTQTTLPITSAQFNFTANSSVPGSRALDVGQILKSWTTYGGTGISYTDTTTPSLVGLTAGSASFDSYTSSKPVSIDVTAIVKSWANSTTANNGIFLAEHTISSYSDTITGPTLIVSYWYEDPF